MLGFSFEGRFDFERAPVAAEPATAPSESQSLSKKTVEMNLKLHSKNANHNSFISKLPIIPKPVDVANETAKQKGFSLGSTFNDD